MSSIELLRQRLEKARRHTSILETKLSKQKRNAETRKKILFGACAIDLAMVDPDFSKALYEHLSRFVKRQSDKELLGLV